MLRNAISPFESKNQGASNMAGDDKDENVDEKKNTLPEENADSNWAKRILLNLSVLILAWILYRAYVTHVHEGEL